MTWVLAVCGLRHADRARGSLADPSFPAAVIRGAIPRKQEARPTVWMHGTHALLEQQALPRVPREWMRRGLVDPLAVRTCAMWQCACRLFSSILSSAAAPCGWLHWLCVFACFGFLVRDWPLLATAPLSLSGLCSSPFCVACIYVDCLVGLEWWPKDRPH